MFLSTIASWGTAEDRPEREAMRALLIGRCYMAAYRAARGGEQEHRLGWWFEWVRKQTATELRWMWRSERAYKDEHTDAYAQVAGDLIIKGVAGAVLVSDVWFRTDISEQYGWLFQAACLAKRSASANGGGVSTAGRAGPRVGRGPTPDRAH